MLSVWLIFIVIWFITFFLFIRAWMAYKQAEKELEVANDDCQKYKNLYTNLHDKFYKIETVKDNCGFWQFVSKLREKPLEDKGEGN